MQGKEGFGALETGGWGRKRVLEGPVRTKGAHVSHKRKVSNIKGENQGTGQDKNSQQIRCVFSMSQMNGIPVPDIQVYGYLLHTHLAGRALQAVQYR